MKTQITAHAVIRRPVIEETVFDPWSIHVGFVVGALEVGAVSLGLFMFSFVGITTPEVYKLSKYLGTTKKL